MLGLLTHFPFMRNLNHVTYLVDYHNHFVGNKSSLSLCCGALRRNNVYLLTFSIMPFSNPFLYSTTYHYDIHERSYTRLPDKIFHDQLRSVYGQTDRNYIFLGMKTFCSEGNLNLNMPIQIVTILVFIQSYSSRPLKTNANWFIQFVHSNCVIQNHSKLRHSL